MKVFLILLLFGGYASAAISESTELFEPNNPHLSVLQQQGKLVTVQLIPGDKTVKFFVQGREKMDLDLNALELSVRNPNSSQYVVMKREGNYFVPNEPISTIDLKAIEVRARSKQKSETFRFKLNTPP